VPSSSTTLTSAVWPDWSIGCDELPDQRGQGYLTSFADHRTGRIVWSSPGRNAQAELSAPQRPGFASVLRRTGRAQEIRPTGSVGRGVHRAYGDRLRA